ncbi:type 1 glutamine amidotransferase domain-containing protein [Thiohalobacter thiocyanaticus]|uniref:Type 1 glutamine amidotransferase n=1 Tax=Thiohalobacter thiocyanaticus TaxID=585455 RepID=A0A426QGL0_9GAMM|nr:type 1 glutamine amidotransferase domain-containing protein [Thiohalobacter thiocyanaticus]RRQ20886.1 type 1 glutamine amidotransferase [Thiohalobacter thiocyanaticus]
MSHIAIIVGDGYEDSEFSVPMERLQTAGHTVDVIGSSAGQTVRGKRGRSETTPDLGTAEADPDNYDALVIPGGFGPDRLRMDRHAVDFVRHFFNSGRPVAAICHGPQLLIEADVVRGLTLTSWPSVKTDLINAGARWVDEAVVEDGNLISSRKPDDLDAFCAALLKRLPDAGTETQHGHG